MSVKISPRGVRIAPDEENREKRDPVQLDCLSH